MFNINTLRFAGLLAGVLLYSGTAFANPPGGCYKAETGKFAASINVPSFLKLNISTPKIGLLGVTSSFTVDPETGGNVFVLSLPVIGMINDSLPTEFHGTWEAEKDPKFTATITDITDMLNMLPGDVTVNQVFSGKVSDSGNTIKGKFVLGIKANISALNMTFKASAKLNSTFVATLTEATDCMPDQAQNASPLLSAVKDQSLAKSATDAANRVANYIVNIFKAIAF